MKTAPFRKLTSFLFIIPAVAVASEQAENLLGCASISHDRQRLACYDRLAASEANASVAEDESRPPVLPSIRHPRPEGATQTATAVSAPDLGRHWELRPEHQQGTFAFRPHNSNYILFANYSSSPNNAPFSPIAGAAPGDARLSNTEVRYQLSFKMKLVEDIAQTPADLWFGYTQESNWQLYNRKASRPFRETDYQPEIMLVAPVDFTVLGLRARFANLGYVHQSNGRGISISRSWDRIYAQLGMERGNFTLTGRAWKRVEENRSEDDNPDIADYMGHGDITGSYRWNDHLLSVLARYNFNTHRGAARLGWAFPLAKNIKGYVEAFSGYGHSLIDYNHSQATVGIGVLFGQ